MRLPCHFEGNEIIYYLKLIKNSFQAKEDEYAEEYPEEYEVEYAYEHPVDLADEYPDENVETDQGEEMKFTPWDASGFYWPRSEVQAQVHCAIIFETNF